MAFDSSAFRAMHEKYTINDLVFGLVFIAGIGLIYLGKKIDRLGK